MVTLNQRGVRVQSNSSGAVFVGPRAYRRKLRRFSTGRLVWGSLLRVLQRITHYKHGDHLEFKIGFSARDLLGKGRVVMDQVEALIQAVQKAGSYQAKDGLKDRVPPDVLGKLTEALQFRDSVRLGRSGGSRQHQPSEPDPK
jgi:hypothetical protein